MNLVIRAHSLKTEILSQSITGHFDERGGTIGRSDDNTLSLPDAERHISRLQAEISFANGGFSIRNVGRTNAITLNGRPLDPGESGPIDDDDELVIGDYSLRASVTAGDADPFAGLVDGAPADPPTTAVHVRKSSTPMQPSTVSARQSADFNPFDPSSLGDLLGTPSKAPAAPAATPSPSPFIDMPTAAQPVAKAAPVRTAPRFEDTRGGDTVPGMRPRTTAFESSEPAPLDALPPIGSSAAHLGEADELDALWAAFCEGAGISLRPPQGLNPALMKIIGQVLARSIDGTLKLVAARAAAKQELRADVTLIQARNNNPLKFSPDAGAAIQQLLQPPMRGFMPGPAAVGEVMDDLLGHAIGSMAGMRAALEGVLDRFEPSQLEGKLSGNSMLDAVLPMNRRARLWELYLQHYQRIHDEAQADFHDLFGKAFITAYEEQLDRLDAARDPL